MTRRKVWPVLVSATAVIAACAGLAYLFELRFTAGDVYPPYSSLRADPSGVKALYESLGRIPGIEVSRSYVPLGRRRGAVAAVFYLGASLGELAADPSELRGEMERTAARGNRIIVALAPFHRPKKDSSTLAIKAWGLEFAQAQENGPLSLAEVGDWRALRTHRGKAVIVERRFGDGAVVLAAETYPFLNQALAERPASETLARLIGDKNRIVFDEAHFGVTESGSVVGLLRKYRLTGLLAGILVVVVLFVWKGAAVFPPPRETEAVRSGLVAGRDSLAAFAGLLERHIPARQALETGWNDWKRTDGRKLTREDESHIEVILNTQPDPLRAYGQARRYLLERKRT